jgi:hypothetical protein
LSLFGDVVRPFCCAPGGMFGGGGGSFCRREVVLRGRVEAMRAVRMKEVRRDIMMIVYVGCFGEWQWDWVVIYIFEGDVELRVDSINQNDCLMISS